jgi:L-alanine-DL-glutamate epimerase-like enolase superfamily enzyme
VSSEDLIGLRQVRERAPFPVEVAAGEYGDDVAYFARMLEAESVDVLQADVTRCAGITELLRVGALCRAHQRPISLHCGPAIHLHPALALEPLRHLEYFHDHVRIEHLLFDGVVSPRGGALHPDLDRPGMGLELKTEDAERYAA